MQTTHFVIIHRPVRHSPRKANEELLVKLLTPDKKVSAQDEAAAHEAAFASRSEILGRFCRKEA